MMRKLVLALAVLLGSFAVVAVPAGAASAKPIKNVKKNQVSGPFTGTSTFDFSTAPCLFAHQVFDATYTVPNGGGTGSFHLDGCTDSGTTEAFPFSGTATVTTPAGTVLTGTASGNVNPTTGALDFTLSLMGRGPVTLTGTWTSSATPGVPGPISGTLS